MRIRAEREGDRDAAYQVNISAFETRFEAKLVDTLREQLRPVVSLVAQDNGQIDGHIMYSPVYSMCQKRFLWQWSREQGFHMENRVRQNTIPRSVPYKWNMDTIGSGCPLLANWN